MDCEIEFLPVGTASKAGDAIVIRYGSDARYEIMTIDGGTQESGAEMVAHIRQEFGTNATIKHAVLTHSDADHASGLREVLKEIVVENLWLHVPWLSAAAARPFFSDKRWTEAGLEKALREEYGIISEIVDLAIKQGSNVYQPFSGDDIGPFKVLWPLQHGYPKLLPQFDRTPEPDQAALEAAQWWIGKQTSSALMKAYQAIAETVQSWVKESWLNERLKDGGQAGASNESSVVLFANLGPGKKILLTGDVGVIGLYMAAMYAKDNQIDISNPNCVQIPHHGSRSNVGPTVLNQIIGPIKVEGSEPHFCAFCSVPADDSKHPRKMVLNAFIRRGAKILLTQGDKKVFPGGFSARPGYSAATHFPFSPSVEDYT